MIEIKGKYNTAKVMLDNIEEKTYSQIETFVNHPEFKGNIAIMPDTHAGMGSVIGFTMPFGERICPNIIGVDIGCGMLAINLGKNVKHTLEHIDKVIRSIIPLGFNVHKKETALAKHVEQLIRKMNMNGDRIKKSLGTLGGGNHFIELGIDENKEYWLTIHTGSRKFGLCVCDYWQRIAYKKELKNHTDEINHFIKTLPPEEREEVIKIYKRNNESPDKYLAFLNKEDTKEYLKDMKIAQDYSVMNRATIAILIVKALKWKKTDQISSIHNYINFEDNIIRKGAISSYKGQRMIIPFNMRDGILICEGKSNSDWNFSAPHGAGRVLSRTQAKKELSMDEFKEQMKGIYSKSVNVNTLDEAPNSYKDAKMIEKAIEPTATIINRIKPVLNIKA